MLKRQKDSVLRGPDQPSKPQFQFTRTILLGLVLAAVALLPGGTTCLDETGAAEFVLEKEIKNFLLVDRLNEQSLEDALLGDEHWEMVYLDDFSAAFVRDSEENREIIGRYAYHVVRPFGTPPFQEEGQEQEALKEYQRAISVNPDFVGGHADLAGVYAYLEEYDLAIEHLHSALELLSRGTSPWSTQEEVKALSVRLYTNLANIHVKAKDWDQAIHFYTRTLELDENNPLALNNLSLIHTSYQMDKEKSLAMLQEYSDYLNREDPNNEKFRGKIKELIVDVEANGPRGRPIAPPSGMIQQGELEKYLEDSLAYLNFLSAPPTPFNSERHGSWDWGAVTDFGTSSTNATRITIMGLETKVATNMRIKQLWHRANAAGNFRIALYTGGTSIANPQNATLQFDSGQRATTGAGWYSADNVDVDWASGEVTHIATKIDTSTYWYETPPPQG